RGAAAAVSGKPRVGSERPPLAAALTAARLLSAPANASAVPGHYPPARTGLPPEPRLRLGGRLVLPPGPAPPPHRAHRGRGGRAGLVVAAGSRGPVRRRVPRG